jgi:predicted Zn-dependent protease
MRRAGRLLVLAALGAAVLPSTAAAEAHASKAATAAPTVCVVPLGKLGKHDRAILPAVVRGIEYVYALEVRTLEARPLPARAWYPARQRYRAEKLLAYLDASVVPDSGCDVVMGFTSADISTTKGTHRDWGMLGYAWIGGPSGVVSTHRMGRRASRRAAAVRAVKVMNHELGHALGLRHHDVDGCLMADLEGTVKTIDREAGLLCDESRHAIEELRGVTLPARARVDWPQVLRGEPRSARY